MVVESAPMGSMLMRPPVQPQFAVTFTVRVQELLAPMEPPVKVTLETSTVAVPPQVLLALPEMIMPVGKESVSGAVSVAAVLLRFRKVMVRVESAPATTVAGLNDLARVGGAVAISIKAALAAAVLLPLLVSSAPTVSLFIKVPGASTVTCTVTVQEPLAGIDPPVRVTPDTPTVAVPPHVVLALPDTDMPLGKKSVSGAVSVAAALLGLDKVMVKVEVPPEVMVFG